MFNSINFPKSTIFTQELSIKLCNLIDLPSNSSYPLIYQASKDGFSANDFHSKVDNTTGTLTVIKTTKGFVFGVFASISWGYQYGLINDANALMFSLVNSYNIPIKLRKLNEYVIDTSVFKGPSFFDISILSYSNISTNYAYVSSSQISTSITIDDMNSFLVGGNTFLVSQIEVYQLDSKIKILNSKYHF